MVTYRLYERKTYNKAAMQDIYYIYKYINIYIYIYIYIYIQNHDEAIWA